MSISRTVLTCSKQNLYNTEIEEDLTESTDVVLAKYLPNVKLENFFTTLESRTRVNYAYLVYEGLVVFIVV